MSAKHESLVHSAGDAGLVLRVAELGVESDGHPLIEELSFTLHRGEVLAILGPNGAGKTVLLRALLGLMASTGEIQWAAGVRIGYVPQRVPYVRDLPLTVADFFGLRARGRVDVAAALRDVGLDATLATQRMGVLSSGQFQRVLIAWALTGAPDVLLFDEPMAGVDAGGAETVHRLLARLNRERNLTLVLVTHDLAIVHELCSTVLCLNRRPICRGAPRQVLTSEVMERMYGGEVDYHQHPAG